MNQKNNKKRFINTRLGTLLRWHVLKNILKSHIKNDMAILDLGGNDGYISYKLRILSPLSDITVVDIDRPGLEIAKSMGLKTLYASVIDLPFSDKSIDIVLCLDIIEHIIEDEKCIHEISRILKKNGNIFLTTPKENGVTFPFMNHESIININRNWGHVRIGYSLEKIKEMFEKNNLILLKKEQYFNILSRLLYRFTYNKRMPLLELLYKFAILLEPYIKLGAQEHIIIGKKE